MSPLLTGVLASQISGHLNTFTLTGSYDALATVTVPSGGASSITFSALPQTGYSHLQLRSFVFSSNTAYSGTLTINGLGGNTHWLNGNGATIQAAYDGSTMYLPLTQGSSSVAYAGITDFLDYTNTNKTKTVKTLGGYDNNGSGGISLTSNLWNYTNSITNITLTAAGSFSQYSQFSLYGIK